MKRTKSKEISKWKRLGVFLILLIIFVVLLNSVKNVYQKRKVVQETLARMEKEALDLENRDEFLKESIEKLSTREGLEFEIRKKLNVAEIGESVAIIVNEEKITSAPNTETSSWQKLKDFFNWLFE